MGRFSENKELVDQVREGMTENLKLAKQNIEFLKSKGAKLPNSAQAADATGD